jgi:hypothetical protein
MWCSGQARGMSLIQLMVSILLAALIIGGIGKVIFDTFKGMTQIQIDQAFEDEKMKIKLALDGCDYRFEVPEAGAYNAVVFNNIDGSISNYSASFERITKQGKPVIAVGDSLKGG